MPEIAPFQNPSYSGLGWKHRYGPHVVNSIVEDYMIQWE